MTFLSLLSYIKLKENVLHSILKKKNIIQSAIKFHIKLVRDIDHIFTVLQTKHSLITWNKMGRIYYNKKGQL